MLIYVMNHMWLIDSPNPCVMEQSWEWTFLKQLTLVNTKMALKKIFTFGLLRYGHFSLT